MKYFFYLWIRCEFFSSKSNKTILEEINAERIDTCHKNINTEIKLHQEKYEKLMKETAKQSLIYLVSSDEIRIRDVTLYNYWVFFFHNFSFFLVLLNFMGNLFKNWKYKNQNYQKKFSLHFWGVLTSWHLYHRNYLAFWWYTVLKSSPFSS